MEALVKAAEAQGEVVTAAKGGTDRTVVKAAVDALVVIKMKITALDPSHPMAHVDKAAKKKAEKARKAAEAAAAKGPAGVAPAEGVMSKNAQKAAAKKALKASKKAANKGGGAPPPSPAASPKAGDCGGGGSAPVAPPAPPAGKAAAADAEGAVRFGKSAPPLAAMAVAALAGASASFAVDASLEGSQPYAVISGARVFGAHTIARSLAGAAAGADALSTALVNQWVELAATYPSRGDVAGLHSALGARLGDATWLVGNGPTLADAACWAAAVQAPGGPAPAGSVKRWLALCEGHAAFAAARATAKSAPTAAAGGGGGGAAGKEGGCPALAGAVEGAVVTRFPPEPSGYLHIGHAKAVLLNDYYAKRYKGKLLVRFDDTNPSKEKGEYADNILRDLATLGIDVAKKAEDGGYVTLSHTSDHFNALAKYALKLIAEGHAFMDDTPQEQMRAERETRAHSKHRDADVKTNTDLFAKMRKGLAKEWCLRAKIDMSSDNGTLRDPVIFRTNFEPHHRTQVQFKAYPTYDLACPIVDSIEGVTHALRTTEYNDRDAQYAWFQKTLKLRPVVIHSFARVNFVRTLMSKRKLAALVDAKAVEGWDDPRFPTIQGVARRGVSMESLRAFIISQGASRNIINMEWDSFWALNKAAYEPTAARLMAVETAGRATLKLTNVPQYADGGVHALAIPLHPKNAEMGERPIRVGCDIILEGDDAASLKVGDEVVLMRWGLVKLTKAAGGAFEGEKIDGDVKKKKTLSWLAETEDLVDVLLVEYDYLIAKNKLEEGDELDAPGVLTPVSKVETPARGDPMLKLASKGDVLQLERRGFFKVDVAWNHTKLSQPMKLIYIPDGRAQHKVPFSRLPSAQKK